MGIAVSLSVAPRWVLPVSRGLACVAARAMVAAGDTVDMHKYAMPIGDEIIKYVSVAENGKGDFRADQLRSALAALPISNDPQSDKMSASMIDFFMWVAETW